MVQLIKSIEYIDMINYDLNSDNSLDLKSKLHCLQHEKKVGVPPLVYEKYEKEKRHSNY